MAWDASNLAEAFDPANRGTRNPAEGAHSATLAQTSVGVRRSALDSPKTTGNSGFALTVPVVRLPGRGLDLALDLFYNSRLWQRIGDAIVFSADGSELAVGWRLGFGKMFNFGPNKGCMLIEADGTKHAFELVDQQISEGGRRKKFTNRTTDGTFIDYQCTEGMTGPTRYDTIGGQARYPNGTVIEFDLEGGHRWGNLYPTRITDANGNFITIAYRNNQGPHIASITDTLGRVVKFHYQVFSNALWLTAITGPGLDGTERTFVQLHYHVRNIKQGISQAFHPSAARKLALPGGVFSFLDAIYFPGMATGYWFGALKKQLSQALACQASSGADFQYRLLFRVRDRQPRIGPAIDRRVDAQVSIGVIELEVELGLGEFGGPDRRRSGSQGKTNHRHGKNGYAKTSFRDHCRCSCRHQSKVFGLAGSRAAGVRDFYAVRDDPSIGGMQ
jgi:hypothetical protein